MGTLLRVKAISRGSCTDLRRLGFFSVFAETGSLVGRLRAKPVGGVSYPTRGVKHPTELNLIAQYVVFNSQPALFRGKMKDWCPLVVSEYKKNLPAASCWRWQCAYLAAKKGVKVTALGTLHRHSCSQRMNINDDGKSWFWFIKPSLSCTNFLSRDLVQPTSPKKNKKCAQFRLAVDCEMCFESYLPDCQEKLCIKKIKIKTKFLSSPQEWILNDLCVAQSSDRMMLMLAFRSKRRCVWAGRAACGDDSESH